ncbi:hypothetical protein [Deinococcus sonorensis]|uniref:Uncharacterized protein n=2 Tax=Deinococcus sonorensis TaxID=309891 RepID=A0AAU7U6E6_9DEIO
MDTEVQSRDVQEGKPFIAVRQTQEAVRMGRPKGVVGFPRSLRGASSALPTPLRRSGDRFNQAIGVDGHPLEINVLMVRIAGRVAAHPGRHMLLDGVHRVGGPPGQHALHHVTNSKNPVGLVFD